MKSVILSFLFLANAYAQIPIPGSGGLPTPTPTPKPTYTDSLQALDTLFQCKSPGSNPLASKIRVFVRKSRIDGRISAHVERSKLSGMELLAHSMVKETRAEGTLVPAEYKGETVHLVISDKRKEGGWFGGSGEEFLSQVDFVDLRGMNLSEKLLCQTTVPYLYR